MSEKDLPRVRWELGQILRPEHLEAQEASLIGDVITRHHLLGLPQHGFARVSWNEERLTSAGQLVLRELLAVLPSGQLVRLGANARLQGEALDLSASGSTRVEVFCSIVPPSEDGPPFTSGPATTVKRHVLPLRLSAGAPAPDALESLKLAVFVKEGFNAWRPSLEDLPPLLTVGGTPFLGQMLVETESRLLSLRDKLARELSISFLGGDSIANVKSALRAIYGFLALMRDLEEGVDRHPYHLFQALRDVYFEIYFYQGVQADIGPDLAVEPYRHDQLGRGLGRLVKAIEKVAAKEWGRAHLAPFARQDDRFELNPIPLGARAAHEVYLVVQKPRVGFAFDIDRVKLSASSRVNTMHRLALVGIPMEGVPVPPFAQQFGPEVEYFRIRAGKEWQHAVDEGSLSFYVLEGFENLRVSLGWRET